MKIADVAKQYCRTQGYVSALVTKIKKNKELLRELIEKRDLSLLKE